MTRWLITDPNSTTTEPRSAQRLVELDSLRGLAALAVVLFHLTYWRDNDGLTPFMLSGMHLKLFRYGVELFFIISGFVIFMSLESLTSSRQFLVSRVARLYPAYWACCIATTAVAYLMESHPPSAVVFAANMTMAETFLRTSYVDNSYWTLGVEIQFYVLIGVIFAVGWLRRIDSFCLGFLGVSLACQLALLTAGLQAPPWVGESFLEYGGFFVIGVSLYRLRNGEGTRLTLVNLLLAVLGTARGGGHQSLSPGQFEYFAGTCALTAIMWFAVTGRLGALRWRPLVFLGEISYPLYLVHQRTGISLTEAFYRHGIPAAVAVAAAALAVGGLAAAVHFTIETPGRRTLRKALMGPPARRLPAARPEASPAEG